MSYAAAERAAEMGDVYKKEGHATLASRSLRYRTKSRDLDLKTMYPADDDKVSYTTATAGIYRVLRGMLGMGNVGLRY